MPDNPTYLIKATWKDGKIPRIGYVVTQDKSFQIVLDKTGATRFYSQVLAKGWLSFAQKLNPNKKFQVVSL